MSDAPVDKFTVLVTELRPLDSAFGELSELIVQDPESRAEGSMILSATEIRDTLGDCPASDFYDVDRGLITWNVGEQ